jgi:hypothetical protein
MAAGASRSIIAVSVPEAPSESRSRRMKNVVTSPFGTDYDARAPTSSAPRTVQERQVLFRRRNRRRTNLSTALNIAGGDHEGMAKKYLPN